jgi:hypothetical protein
MELQKIQEEEQKEVDRLALLERGKDQMGNLKKRGIDGLSFHL